MRDEKSLEKLANRQLQKWGVTGWILLFLVIGLAVLVAIQWHNRPRPQAGPEITFNRGALEITIEKPVDFVQAKYCVVRIEPVFGGTAPIPLGSKVKVMLGYLGKDSEIHRIFLEGAGIQGAALLETKEALVTVRNSSSGPEEEPTTCTVSKGAGR